MAKGTQYSKQFKEDAVRYRKDHPELTVQKAASIGRYRASTSSSRILLRRRT